MRTIVLAHESDFAIGPILVQPSLRTITRGDRQEILEPRVMQVLTVLAASTGTVVARDDLVEACWEGRIVGDDAINRVIGRLRRCAEGLGAGVFTIDTVTRVGHRLRLIAGEKEDVPGNPAQGAASSRRALLFGGSAIGLAAIAGVLARRRPKDGPLSPESTALLQQAKVAQWQNTREGQNQAIGLYRQIVTRNPDFADGWGYLATAYAWTAHYRRSDEASMLRDRAKAAAARSASLDPGNALAQLGSATARPFIGNWLSIERALRSAVAKRPDNDDLSFSLALLLGSVGRGVDALKYMKRVLPSGASPGVYFYQAQLLWTAGQIEDLDNLLTQARQLYPTHFALWFIRFYSYIFSGRAQEAIALAADKANLPTGIDMEEIAAVTDVAEAMVSRSASKTARVVEEWKGRAREGAGYAENAAQFMAALGQHDDAFAILDGYYFSKGFDCGEIRFSESQGTYTPRNDRLTFLLFTPGLASIRADPRFGRLLEQLGLRTYWNMSGSNPDYLAR